ncbi:hypothetical protein B0H63DRAFT_486954 [Podospora didyma]|uniref:Uncharacterized protein n=1 Tax=Podospora didyma TaxID=330526 RepID=A0AAE0K6L1_9PEZI|nr:hypothetical protein B0H63DRAFT_486954 [Podospora didyma]
MDENDADRWKDHSGSALAAALSRGVSTSNPGTADFRHQHDPSPAGPGALSGPAVDRRRSSLSPYPPHQASHSRRQSGSSDGASSQRSNGKGKGPMEGLSSWAAQAHDPTMNEEATTSMAGDDLVHAGSAHDVGFADVDYSTSTPRHFSRPPQPPPLTSPTLSGAVFPFEDRRPSYAVSIPPELDTSFIHQPNPDYNAGSTSTDILSSSPQSTAAMPRRRSYTKSVPIGIPIPTTASASSSAETMTSAGTFSPSSYPPTSPLLPPPPPDHDYPSEYEFVGGPGGPGIFLSQQEIDVHGEVISVMDDAGHGWKRHTRVYGGGVCLACIAAGGQGGFYGDKVPLADRR